MNVMGFVAEEKIDFYYITSLLLVNKAKTNVEVTVRFINIILLLQWVYWKLNHSRRLQ